MEKHLNNAEFQASFLTNESWRVREGPSFSHQFAIALYLGSGLRNADLINSFLIIFPLVVFQSSMGCDGLLVEGFSTDIFELEWKESPMEVVENLVGVQFQNQQLVP